MPPRSYYTSLSSQHPLSEKEVIQALVLDLLAGASLILSHGFPQGILHLPLFVEMSARDWFSLFLSACTNTFAPKIGEIKAVSHVDMFVRAFYILGDGRWAVLQRLESVLVRSGAW